MVAKFYRNVWWCLSNRWDFIKCNPWHIDLRRGLLWMYTAHRTTCYYDPGQIRTIYQRLSLLILQQTWTQMEDGPIYLMCLLKWNSLTSWTNQKLMKSKRRFTQLPRQDVFNFFLIALFKMRGERIYYSMGIMYL